MKIQIICGLTAFALTVIAGFLIIPLLKKLKAGQPILKYVTEHKEKSGTPTMGGLFFVLPSIVVFLIFNGIKQKSLNLSIVITLSYMIIGFLDDFLKIKFKKNEGLKPYQKIIFQLSVAIIAGVFVYLNGLYGYRLPYTKKIVSLGLFSLPLTIIIFLAITNSVNLTDGLDGLASGTSISYLLVLSILVFLQTGNASNGYIGLCACFIGGLLGFLVFNTHKASVFMGDTGSLALGGLIGSVSIFTENSLFIPIIGIMFVLSSISVIVQVAYFKRTKKRIFLMAPLHHHFQEKGVSESKISFSYFLITLIIGLTTLAIY